MSQREDPEGKKLPRWALVLGGCGCLGIFIVVAGWAAVAEFHRFELRTKAAEATTNHRQMTVLMAERCDAGEDIEGFTAGPLPQIPTTDPQVADFTLDPGFMTLGFAPTGPFRYSYSIRSEPGVVVLTARGDLDGDGALSTWESRCDVATCVCERPPATQELE